jgi:hypothetical protein
MHLGSPWIRAYRREAQRSMQSMQPMQPIASAASFKAFSSSFGPLDGKKRKPENVTCGDKKRGSLHGRDEGRLQRGSEEPEQSASVLMLRQLETDNILRVKVRAKGMKLLIR